MTPAQQRAYWAEWKTCSAALVGLGHAGDDYQRRQLQAQAIGGLVKSSASLTNAELTLVLAKFRSYSRPADFAAQMHAQEEPGQRRAETLAEILRHAEARGVKGGLAGASRYFHKFLADVSLEKATDDKLRRLLCVLKNREVKPSAKPAPAASSPAPAPENTTGWDGQF